MIKTKSIKGFEGIYTIRSDGKIWCHITKRYLRPENGKVKLAKKGRYHVHEVEKLLKETFGEERIPQMDI